MTSPRSQRITLIEDTTTQARLFSDYLTKEGYEVTTHTTGEKALATLSNALPETVILDLELPDLHGFDILDHLHRHHPDIPVIIITASQSIDQAIEAMKKGAFDFIVKPFPLPKLSVTVEKALAHRALLAEVTNLRRTVGIERYYDLIGQSAAMQATYRIIEAVAPSRASIFIEGESGTGKDLVAAALHRASPRRSKPFITLNCAAIPPELMETTLFGAYRDTHTGTTPLAGAAKQAHGGTLFLDEVCDMPLEIQTKLLRFTQTGEIHPLGATKADTVDVRIIASTNRDPRAEIKERRFREDLYYRLHVVPIELPPLREREEDIMLLAQAFLNRYSVEEGKNFTHIAPEVGKIFRFYDWPGNVRQLENIMRNIIVLNNGPIVTAPMLPKNLQSFVGKSLNMPANQNAFDLALTQEKCGHAVKPLWQVEKEAIQAALTFTDNDLARTAAFLEISPASLCRKIQLWENTAPRENYDIIAV